MRSVATSILTFALCLPLATSPAHAQSAGFAFEDPPAEQVVARLRKAGRTIERSGNTDLRAQAQSAAEDVAALADRLESTLQGRLGQPVSALRDDFEHEVALGLSALRLAEDVASLATSCPGEDLAALLGAFRENLRRALDASADGPRILRVTGVEDDVPTGVRTGSARVLVLHGNALHSDDCGPASAVIAGGDEKPMEVEAYSHNPSRLDFTVPALERPGVYDVTVRLRRRKLLFLCRSTTARFSIAALPPGEFRVEYEITSTRNEEQEIVWNAGELKLTNERCDADTTAVHHFRLPDGWTYVSHDWIVYLNDGAEKQKEEVVGDEVHVGYRLPRRGPLCTGDARMIHGKMEIRGKRLVGVPGPRFVGTHRRTLGPGETLTISMKSDSTASPSIVAWKVEVRLIQPDGRIQRLSPGEGDGPLSGKGTRGGVWLWNPSQGRLRVSAPGRSCPSA